MVSTNSAPCAASTAFAAAAAATTAAVANNTASTTVAAANTDTNADTSDNGVAVAFTLLTVAGAAALVSRKRK